MLGMVKPTSAAAGKDKMGIRLSPFGVLNDLIRPESETGAKAQDGAYRRSADDGASFSPYEG